MKKIIFSKYSNDRNEKLRIRTDILLDEQGKKYVQKRGMDEAAKGHMEHTFRAYELLSEVFAPTGVLMNQCTKENDALEFEYLEGHSLEQILDTFLYKEDTKTFIEVLDQYVTKMRSVATEEFQITEEFKQVFGDIVIPHPFKAASATNIDMIFQNLIEVNGIWQAIDYEWTFFFPVPIDYVIYRAIHYYVASSRAAFVKERFDLYKIVGFTTKECELYEQMERNFQAFILQDNTPMFEMYQGMSGQSFFPIQVIESNRKESEYRKVIIRRDFGNGFEGNDMILFPQMDEHGKIILDFPIEPDLKRVLITPAQVACVVQIYSLSLSGLGAMTPDYITNGFTKDHAVYCYVEGRPEIWIDNFGSCMNKLHLECVVSILPKATLFTMANMIEACAAKEHEFNLMKQELHQMQEEKRTEQCSLDLDKAKREVEQVTSELQRVTEELSILKGSASWRMTKPMRAVLDALKGKR